MDLGFETIGNATLIGYDKGPLFATDPWIYGSAYFGSWITSHEVPEEQVAAIKAAQYLWISHGHPDHLNPECIDEFKGQQLLMPDHVGGRIQKELTERGFKVRVLEDGVWTPLSDRVRVQSISDINQDGILLVEMDGRLIVNLNDANGYGAAPRIAELLQSHPDNYLLCLTGYGDADMINFFDEAGERVPPPAMKREPFLDGIEEAMAMYGFRNFVPFSSQHKYQRTDSVWANACATPVEAYQREFHSPERQMLPAFCHRDFTKDEVRALAPKPNDGPPRPPEDFGDDWSVELEPGDLEKLRAYFHRIEHLKTFLGFVNFRVGGKDNVIDIARDRFERGVTFEVPRASLMTCIEWQIFDDLLIGNFMRTILHGDWAARGAAALYPDFTPFVTKYGDNGGAHTTAELRAYFAAYQARGFLGFHPLSGETDRSALAAYL